MKTYKIGRLTANDICYNHELVSRQHADITFMDDGRILLTDHSKNGTTVNGRSINQTTVEIRRGDNVVFAGVQSLNWEAIQGSSIPTPAPAPIIAAPDDPDPEEEESNGMAVAGFVLSFLIPVLGLIFSIIGVNYAKNLPTHKGHGLAVAGIILSCIWLVIGIIISIIVSVL